MVRSVRKDASRTMRPNPPPILRDGASRLLRMRRNIAPPALCFAARATPSSPRLRGAKPSSPPGKMREAERRKALQTFRAMAAKPWRALWRRAHASRRSTAMLSGRRPALAGGICAAGCELLAPGSYCPGVGVRRRPSAGLRIPPAGTAPCPTLKTPHESALSRQGMGI